MLSTEVHRVRCGFNVQARGNAPLSICTVDVKRLTIQHRILNRFDIINGHHADAGENSMLIQIVDFFDTFPTPKYNFKEVLQFKFDDVLDGPTACTDLQAQEIANALQRAKEQHMNVIVHCFAGLCRSGAVAEVGIMLGFNPPDCIRIPNSTVKNKMLKALGMKIDESTSVFAQEFYNREFD